MSKGYGLLSISSFLPKSFSNCLRWCVSGGLAIVILSFQEPPLAATAPGLQVAAQATENTAFPDNTATFETTDDEVRAVKVLLINQLQTGLRAFDLSLIEAILAPDFQRRTIVSQEAILIETREAYLEAIREWDKHSAGSREVLYAIQSASVDETRTRVNILLVATYRSKYFNPRFLETFLFEKTNGRWMLKRQAVLPLNPRKPELYDVQIFVSARRYHQSYIQREFARGPDSFVELFRKGSLQKGVPTDNIRRTVLFVFREPPPVGAEITVTHDWWSPDVGHPTPSRFKYTVEKSDPFFVIANETWVGGGSGGEITYEVFLDGQKIGKKDVAIMEPYDVLSTVESTAPLPENVRVIRPSPKVPKELAAFSGKWTGAWRERLDHILIVEEVSPPYATIIYSWGIGSPRYPPRWRRITGTFYENALHLTLGNGAKVTYRMRSDSTLDATHEKRDRILRATMTRAQ